MQHVWWGLKESAETEVNHIFFCHNEHDKCMNLTKKPCDFIGLLLLNLLVIQGFKEDVQDQYIFSGKWRDKNTPKRFLFLVISHDTK